MIGPRYEFATSSTKKQISSEEDPCHAMTLLGSFTVSEECPPELRVLCQDDETLWVIQNPWAVTIPVILMTSRYLAHSEATVTFFEKSDRTLKAEPEVDVCTSPIAECTSACAPDGADWGPQWIVGEIAKSP